MYCEVRPGGRALAGFSPESCNEVKLHFCQNTRDLPLDEDYGGASYTADRSTATAENSKIKLIGGGRLVDHCKSHRAKDEGDGRGLPGGELLQPKSQEASLAVAQRRTSVYPINRMTAPHAGAVSRQA